MAAPLLEPLLANLSPIERNELHLWLESPLHNRRKDVRALYKSLVSKEKNEENSGVEHRLTRSYLLDRVEAYLLWKYNKKSTREQHNDLQICQIYRERGLSRHLRNRLNRLERKKYPFHDPAALYNRYIFSELLNERNHNRDRSHDPDYDRPDRELLLAQTAARFRQAAISLAGAQFSGRELELPLLDVYLELIEKRPDLLDEPGLALYYHICLYQLPEPPEDLLPYPELIELLLEQIDCFPPSEQSDLLKLVLNFAIRRLNQNTSRENVMAAFQLYDLGLREELLLESGHLTNFTFNNFIGTALRLGNTEAAQYCIDHYAQFLRPDSAEEVMALNQARLAYARGEWQEAIFLLQQADYRDSVHLINARNILMRCYYELGETEPLLDLIRATRILIRRRKLGYHQQIVLNNLKFMKKLVKLPPNNKQMRQALQKEIAETKLLSEREWLLEKLNN